MLKTISSKNRDQIKNDQFPSSEYKPYISLNTNSVEELHRTVIPETRLGNCKLQSILHY